MKKVSTVRAAYVSLVVLLAVVLAKPAFGEVVAKTGVLRVQGTGQIWAYGQGEVRLKLDGKGKLIVRHVDKNRVTVNGDGTRMIDGAVITFISFKGTVTVNGPKIAVFYDGVQAELEAVGDAKVVLSGKGTYTINDDKKPTDWDESGATIALGNPTVAEEDQIWGGPAQQPQAAVEQAQPVVQQPREVVAEQTRTFVVTEPPRTVIVYPPQTVYVPAQPPVVVIYDEPPYPAWVPFLGGVVVGGILEYGWHGGHGGWHHGR